MPGRLWQLPKNLLVATLAIALLGGDAQVAQDSLVTDTIWHLVGGLFVTGQAAVVEAQSDRRLWTCPKCGHNFVTPNMWHSCSNYTLEHHFADKELLVRQIFDRFLAVIESCGPITVIPQKSRIAIQARVRFAGGVARKKWFNAALWLTRTADHPCLYRIETFGPASYGLRFRLRSPLDIDDALEKVIQEAYRVGLQEHLGRD